MLLGMVLYVATRDAEKEPIIKRLAKTGASAFLAVGLSPEVAPQWFLGSENLATVVIMTVGLLALDIATALFRDREFIKDMIRRRMGGK